MAPDVLIGILRLSDLFLALFILLFSYLALYKVSKRKERQPWDYLFLASFVFFVYQVYMLISYFVEASWAASMHVVPAVAEFLFGAFVLMAFISQHHLVDHFPIVMLSRKREQE